MTQVEERTPTVTRHVDASPASVWEVLNDGWLYPVWVVGAARMREVDDTWPSAGSKLHHSVGNWPLMIDDQTEVLEVEPGRRLRLLAHAWPAGAAEVSIDLEAHGTGTLVTIAEDAARGPARLVPKPLRQAAMVVRNREALRRLAFIAEGRTDNLS